MRAAFIETLYSLAAEDDSIVLLTGDLGYMVMEPFRDRYPNRFFNVGVAEQNMMGLATGLAEAGFQPWVYSIATFASLRSFEFIRNGPVLHHLPVRIVGVGTGFEYGHAGSTHHAVEDVAVLRALNGLTIVVPADPAQTHNAMRATHRRAGPIYFSLGKDDRSFIPGLEGRFELGRVQVVRQGASILLVSMGSVTVEAVAAAEELACRGIEAGVAVVSSFNPDADEDMVRLLASYRHAISIEAQVASGGLSAWMAAVIAQRGVACRLRALAVSAPPDGTSGPRKERWCKHGLDRGAIVENALAALGVLAR